jgi:hypothetical protein
LFDGADAGDGDDGGVVGQGGDGRSAVGVEDAINVVKRDPPLMRYKVRLFVARALHQQGIMREDKVALLRHAERLAQETIQRFPSDKRAYLAYADVGDALARVGGDRSVLNHAIHEMHSVRTPA